MTIGEKIVKLRNANNISQEELAEKLSVSRQSISKWEVNASLPTVDKIMNICQIFSVSVDTLLNDTEVVTEKKKNKYFGTDGFRGEANKELTSMHAYKIGRFLGWYFSSPLSGNNKTGYKPRIVIGKDTRRSSYMLEYSIVAGITASGADAYMLHVTTTPSVSYVTRMDEFDCGIMITASHNPFYDNGIKIINKHGEKFDDDTTSLIEDYLDGDLSSLGIVGNDLPLAHKDRIGRIVDYVAGRNRYVGYLISLASHSYKNLKIGLDCANGASWMIAKSVFGALGAQISIIGDSPDGLNVNENCGSTHIENLCKLVKEQHLDLGFAFDGDCDRCIAVNSKGEVCDGDSMLYILGKRLKSRGVLEDNTIVVTVMSNSGLIKSLKDIGIKCEQTAVGDRFVYECMQNKDLSLGGEQSGHIIIKKYATTGDGLLTAIMIAEEICDTKLSLEELCENIKLYPQYTINVRVKDKNEAVNDPKVKESVQKAEALIDGKGRVLLRQSGTEPVIRIMIEAETEEKCKLYADSIAETVKKEGHLCE